jgi:hypothetical protein
MHGKQKTKPRLPVGVVEKLQKNTGGGAHRNQKTDYKRHQKHRNRGVGESYRFAIFIQFLNFRELLGNWFFYTTRG